jgi:hypothetical protein
MTPQTDLPGVELTAGSRFRKLGLCVLAVVAVTAVQVKAAEPVTWPLVAVLGIIVVAFVAGNVLARLADSTVVSKAVQALADKARALAGQANGAG